MKQSPRTIDKRVMKLVLDVCKKLKEARENANLTQEQLGTQIGKSKQWISELERGNIRLTYEYAMSISAVYGKTPDYFLPEKSINNGLFEAEQDDAPRRAKSNRQTIGARE